METFCLKYLVDCGNIYSRMCAQVFGVYILMVKHFVDAELPIQPEKKRKENCRFVWSHVLIVVYNEAPKSKTFKRNHCKVFQSYRLPKQFKNYLLLKPMKLH